MFKKVRYYMIQLDEGSDIGEVLRIAAKHNLVGLHKIGVYEDIQQDELYLKGKWIDMVRFTKEVSDVIA